VAKIQNNTNQSQELSGQFSPPPTSGMLSPVPDNETETGKNSPSLEQTEEKTKTPERVKTQAPLILSVS